MLRLPFIALLLCGGLSSASGPLPSPPPDDPASVLVLRDGQEVVLRNIEPISSNHSKPGDVITFEVIRSVTSEGAVVVPEHAVAVGRVESTEHAKLAHHGGKLVVAIASVQLANGDYARLRAVESRKERNFGWQDVGGATLIAATIYYMPLAPVYLLAKGDDVNIPPGTRFTAYLDGDVRMDRASLEAAAPRPALQPENATIYIFRGNQDKEPSVEQEVSCGQSYLGRLTDSQYLKLKVVPGRYWIYAYGPYAKLSASQQQTAMVALDASAGQTYYLEVARVQGSKWKSPAATLRQVDEPVAADEIANAQNGAVLSAEVTLHEPKLRVRPKGVKPD